ncbi:MAG: RdgB/HAM1 family non-canonical purine NTP pyrophosphatase [Bacteroidota bacterium]
MSPGRILPLVVFATQNRGKARELEALLAGIASRFESLRDHPEVPLPPEEEASYTANALAKARAVSAALSLPAIGDDSGLEVDALGGAPGIRSARFAGEGAGDAANNALLLNRLRGVPAERRTAQFRCVLAFVDPRDAREVTAEGLCVGTILESPRGNHGFGYDPLFLPRGGSRSFAELTGEAKDAMSHRGRAAKALRAKLGST